MTTQTQTRTNRKRPRNRVLRAVPDPQELTVETLLHELPDGFVECRSYNRHNLKRVALFTWGANKDCTCRVSKCTACGTRVEDYYLPNGEKMDRQYIYPDGYLITGHGKIPTDTIMRILMGRHEIIDPSDLPNSVTRHLSNKALSAINSAP